MVAAVAVSFLLVMLVVYVPLLQPFFDTVPLGADDWLMMLPFFFASPVAMELLKLYFRRRAAAPAVTAAVPEGGEIMRRILVPVRGTPNCEAAVQRVVREFMNDTATEVHLLNVQAPFPHDIARFVRRRERDGFQREQAEQELRSCRERLDRFGVPYAVHVAVGDSAHCITELARKLRCDRIVMGTARKNTLTRLVEDSVTNKVLQLTSVPVEVVAGEAVSQWERWGIPAAIAAALALFMAAAD